MAHESTRYALDVAQNRVMVLEKKLDDLENSTKAYNDGFSFGNIGLKKLVNTIIKLHNSGLDIDTIVTRIEKLNK